LLSENGTQRNLSGRDRKGLPIDGKSETTTALLKMRRLGAAVCVKTETAKRPQRKSIDLICQTFLPGQPNG